MVDLKDFSVSVNERQEHTINEIMLNYIFIYLSFVCLSSKLSYCCIDRDGDEDAETKTWWRSGYLLVQYSVAKYGYHITSCVRGKTLQLSLYQWSKYDWNEHVMRL